MQESHRFHQYGAGLVGSTFHLVNAEQSLDIQPWTPSSAGSWRYVLSCSRLAWALLITVRRLPPRCHFLFIQPAPSQHGDNLSSEVVMLRIYPQFCLPK